MSTKTLYTCAWGGYWERFGKKWIKQVNALNTKPDQIFVVSDKMIDCPFDVILADPNHKPYAITSFRQAAVNHTTSDWYCPIDIDDDMFPNFLDNIQDEYDVHAHYAENWPRDNAKESWEFLFQNESSKSGGLISGVTFIKSHVVKYLGIPTYGHDDATLGLMLRHSNVSVYFDSVPRYYYCDHETNQSKQSFTKTKDRQHHQIFLQLQKTFDPSNKIKI